MFIPTIDFSNCLSTNEEDLKKLSNEVIAACKTIGFFEIVNHPIPFELQQRVMKYSDLFFKLPTKDKLEVSFEKNPKTSRGYELFGSQKFEENQKPDIKEGYYLGRELALDHPLVVAGKTHCAPNVWPDDIASFQEHAQGFKDTMNEYMAKVRELSKVMLKIIGYALDLPGDYWDDYLHDGIATLRLLHYPGKEKLEENERGIGSHTDWGMVTFLMQDSVGGLEVLDNATGNWEPIQSSVPGAYVVNLGDMMPWITNDVFKSNSHRVINKKDERFSVAFFVDGHPDYVMKCLPAFEHKDGSPNNYPEITVGEYLMKKYRDTQQAIIDKRNATK